MNDDEIGIFRGSSSYEYPSISVMVKVILSSYRKKVSLIFGRTIFLKWFIHMYVSSDRSPIQLLLKCPFSGC